jgi:paraquat-inducible protein B
MGTLTSKQATELGDAFLAFAQAVGDYRMKNRKKLSDQENTEIKEHHRKLLDHADEFYTTSAKLAIDDVEQSLDELRKVTKQINNTYASLKKVQNAIDIAAAGIALASSIIKADAQNAGKALQKLVQEWKAIKAS